MTPNNSAAPGRGAPVKTIQLDEETVHLFAPSGSLFAELAEIRRAPRERTDFTIDVLRTVTRYCSDTEFEGSTVRLATLLREILKTWDTRYIPHAVWEGFVREAAVTFFRGVSRLNAFISLAIDPHPELTEEMRKVGRGGAQNLYTKMMQRPEDEQTPTPANHPPLCGKGKDINGQMLVMLSKDTDYYGWSASQFAEHLSCAEGTVKGTQAWKQIITYRAHRVAERLARTGAFNGGRGRRQAN